MVGAASPPPPPAARGALWRLASAPASRRVGCARPRPTPAPPARRARRGPRDAGSGPSPRFRGPGPARCVAGVLGPGPRSAHCARKSTYFAPSPGSSRPRCSRSWPQTGGRGGSPAGRGARARGARVYMVQGLFLLFFHPPQPSFSQLREAGRTDVQRAPLPLPRGRWPGPAAPTWLRGCGSRGKKPANPGTRAAGSPRGPDGAHAVGRPRAARDAPRNPPGCSSRRPARTPEGGPALWAPPTPALAPLHLPLWASGPRRVRAAGSPRWFAEEERVGQQLGGCLRGGGAGGRSQAWRVGNAVWAHPQSAGRAPCPVVK